MPYVLRVTSLPTTAEIVRVPQIVIVDQTGPAIPLGTSPGVSMLVAEFLKGPVNVPTELSGGGQAGALFGNVSGLLSQDAAGVQNAGGVAYEGNGQLQLAGKKFKRLGVTRVDTEEVTADGGATKSPLTITVTVAAADQAAGVSNKDIVVPAGTRFGDNAVFATATKVVAASQDLLIPKGSTVTANTVTGTVNCFTVKRPAPVATIAAVAINAVIDSALDNVSTGTSITAVTNAAALWPPGTGTSVSARIEFQTLLAIAATVPGTVDVTVDVVAIWAARRTTAIRQALLANASASSESGRGRIALGSCDPSAGLTAANAAAAVTAAAGLAASESLQSDRMMLTFPQAQVVSSALAKTVTINADGYLASVLSNFPNEVNPGASPIDTVGVDLLGTISAIEACFGANPISKTDNARLLAGGVCPLQKDRSVGWWFLNGITAANATTQPTRVPAKRRRMADEIQDSLAGIAAKYLKQPATTERVDAFTGEIETYLQGLLSPDNKAAQRIVSWSLDAVSLNTADLTALGIYVLGVKVRLLASMDDIIYITQVGETVTTSVIAA